MRKIIQGNKAEHFFVWKIKINTKKRIFYEKSLLKVDVPINQVTIIRTNMSKNIQIKILLFILVSIQV